MTNKIKIRDEILEVLKNIVAIDTCYPPGHTLKISQFIKKYLSGSGFNINMHSKNKNKPNIVLKNYKGNKSSIVFNCHIDTVKPILKEWKTPPFTLKIRGSKCIGLGSVNCKGSTAVHLYFAKNFKKLFPNYKNRICFTFVTDEENLGPEGTKFLKDKKIIKPHTLVLGAPTNNNFIVEERGVFWLNVEVFGKTSHAGDPIKGINSITKAAKIINLLEHKYKKRLKKYDTKYSKSTINVGIINGGENVNVVPHITNFEIDRRITIKEDINKSFREIKSFIKKIDKSAKVSFLRGTNAFKSNKSNIYLKSLINSYSLINKKKPNFLNSIGVSDGRYFANDKINIINIGPGDGDQGHKSNETLIIKELVDYFLILKNFIKSFE
tara:strand:- start:85 stop:1227 length:1143 start_codon:yes stop_codon:yes gene_type:complete